MIHRARRCTRLLAIFYGFFYRLVVRQRHRVGLKLTRLPARSGHFHRNRPDVPIRSGPYVMMYVRLKTGVVPFPATLRADAVVQLSVHISTLLQQSPARDRHQLFIRLLIRMSHSQRQSARFAILVPTNRPTLRYHSFWIVFPERFRVRPFRVRPRHEERYRRILGRRAVQVSFRRRMRRSTLSFAN